VNLARPLAALAAALVLPLAVATPASASPEDGKGCAGVPTLPQAYVCVISTTPQNAVPTTTTTTIPVAVPRVCYVADCAGPTTVNVPVPGVTPGSGAVAVLWYQGVYYPIAVGQVPSLTLLQPYVTLVTGLAGTAVTTATTLAGTAVTTATSLAGTAVTIAFGVAGDAGALADAYVAFALDTAAPWVAFARALANDPPTAGELRNLVIENTIGQDTYGALVDFISEVRGDPTMLACVALGVTWQVLNGDGVQCA
jgi:hypothetical protein